MSLLVRSVATVAFSTPTERATTATRRPRRSHGTSFLGSTEYSFTPQRLHVRAHVPGELFGFGLRFGIVGVAVEQDEEGEVAHLLGVGGSSVVPGADDLADDRGEAGDHRDGDRPDGGDSGFVVR